MSSSKRSQGSSRSSMSRINHKQKDVLTSTSRSKSESRSLEITTNYDNVPIIRQAENTKMLPTYSSVLARCSDKGVSMDDLDQLQQDLEKLLSSCATRTRFLLGDIEATERGDDRERRDREKTSQKRRKIEDKPKHKDQRSGSRVIKKQQLPLRNFVGVSHLSLPKITLSKNDTSDKFWASIEPYCANFTKDDLAFLDSLIKECSKEPEMRIPEKGEHYAVEWHSEMGYDEQNMGKSSKTKTNNNTSEDLKKNMLNAVVDTFSSPLTQRVLAAQIPEKVITTFPNVDRLKPTDFIVGPKTSSQRGGSCLDKRLRRELVEHINISMGDLPKSGTDDDILVEIKKCQQELIALNEYNVRELNKLKKSVLSDMKKQDVKNELEHIDNQLLDIYNKILDARKAAQQAEGEDFDKNVFAQQIAKDYEDQVDDILKQEFTLTSFAYPECRARRELPNGSTDHYFFVIN